MIWPRVRAQWRLKLVLTVALNLLFWAGYAFLSRHVFLPVRTPPLTWFDRAIPFAPEPWAWVYVSQFLFTSTLPWWLATAAGLRRYVIGLACLCGVSFVVFFAFPVASPRSAILDTSGMLAWIAAYDGTYNAFPSLHAGFLVFLGGLAWRLFGNRAPRWLFAVGIGWGGAILFSTIATRQHYAIDLLAGGALGAVADWVAWRSSPEARAVMMSERSSGRASQAGCR